MTNNDFFCDIFMLNTYHQDTKIIEVVPKYTSEDNYEEDEEEELEGFFGYILPPCCENNGRLLSRIVIEYTIEKIFDKFELERELELKKIEEKSNYCPKHEYYSKEDYSEYYSEDDSEDYSEDDSNSDDYDYSD